MSKNVLVVAAHPDDEALGCGGTIARHAANGDDVSVVFMADGVSARGSADEETWSQRERATNEAQSILGLQKVYHLGLPDNQLDTMPLLEVVQKLEALLDELKPELIYTHHSDDLNIDHRITHQAVLTACRPIPGQTVREIYAFEVLSATEWGLAEFTPNVFIDIAPYLDTKLAALSAYACEMRPEPHARSLVNVRRQAELRGASVGLWAAESFCLVRHVCITKE